MKPVICAIALTLALPAWAQEAAEAPADDAPAAAETTAPAAETAAPADVAAPTAEAEAPPTGVVTYQFEAGHSHAIFEYDHMGFSTSHGVVNGIEGTITLNADDPAASTVEARFPISSIKTVSPELDEHLASAEFFGSADAEVTFVSKTVEQTGDQTANVTGDLTMNGQTKPVTLEVTMNKRGVEPIEQKQAAGFTATTTIKRSDYGLDAFVPAVSDEMPITLNIEAQAE